MAFYARYDASTGEVLAVLEFDESQLQYQTGTFYEGVVDPETQYVDVTTGNTLLDRPLLPEWSATTLVANGTASISIGPWLPTTTRIDIDVPLDQGMLPVYGYNETSGIFSFSTTVPGLYTVRIRPFPYQNTSTTITAT